MSVPSVVVVVELHTGLPTSNTRPILGNELGWKGQGYRDEYIRKRNTRVAFIRKSKRLQNNARGKTVVDGLEIRNYCNLTQFYRADLVISAHSSANFKQNTNCRVATIDSTQYRCSFSKIIFDIKFRACHSKRVFKYRATCNDYPLEELRIKILKKPTRAHSSTMHSWIKSTTNFHPRLCRFVCTVQTKHQFRIIDE